MQDKRTKKVTNKSALPLRLKVFYGAPVTGGSGSAGKLCSAITECVFTVSSAEKTRGINKILR